MRRTRYSCEITELLQEAIQYRFSSNACSQLFTTVLNLGMQMLKEINKRKLSFQVSVYTLSSFTIIMCLKNTQTGY